MRRKILASGLAAASAAFVMVTSGVPADAQISHHISNKTLQGTGWASSNWSGYAVTGSGLTSASGSWVVPAVKQSHKATYSSNWVGVDGFNNSNLIQTGTEQDFYNGSAHYYAWWEILPAAETRITSMTVKPGDSITASVAQVTGTTWIITVSDNSNGQSFSTTQNYSGPLTSAEWVEEAPTVGGHVATLANYGSSVFDPGTVNGSPVVLNASEAGVMIQGRSQVSTPSAPDSEADGFAVAYGATAPAPPAS